MGDYLLGIDAGGTSFKCLLASFSGGEEQTFRIATGAPEPTLTELTTQIESRIDLKDLKAVGLAAFGPLNLDRSSPDFGALCGTPKPGWSGFPIRRRLSETLMCPVSIQTDVNAALLAELEWGAGQGSRDLVYTTFGTGIGAGIIADGTLVGGDHHPKVGHIPMGVLPGDVPGFTGVCPFHGDCFEGLASAPALEARWGQPPDTLRDNHPAWDLQARYVARYCTMLTYILRPERILLGGGLMEREGLIEKIQTAFLREAADYALHPRSLESLYISRSGLGGRSGLMGGLWLARQCFQEGTP